MLCIFCDWHNMLHSIGTDHIRRDTSRPLGLCYAATYQHPKWWVCTACPTYTAWFGFTLC